MKIVTICGWGIGSSLIILANIINCLKKLNRHDIEVEHTSITQFNSDKNDEDILVICAKDFDEQIDFKSKISLNNLLDQNEMLVKLQLFLKNH